MKNRFLLAVCLLIATTAIKAQSVNSTTSNNSSTNVAATSNGYWLSWVMPLSKADSTKAAAQQAAVIQQNPNNSGANNSQYQQNLLNNNMLNTANPKTNSPYPQQAPGANPPVPKNPADTSGISPR